MAARLQVAEKNIALCVIGKKLFIKAIDTFLTLKYCYEFFKLSTVFTSEAPHGLKAVAYIRIPATK